MLSGRKVTELDSYVARLVEVALTGARTKGDRLAILRRASELGRRIALLPIQAHLSAAIEHGEAPETFNTLQELVERRYQSFRRKMRYQRHQTRGAVTQERVGFASEPMLSPGEVARELGVSPKTVANWCTKGLMRCEVLESGHRRIPGSSLDAFRAARRRWDRLDAVSEEARKGAPPPDDDAIFAEIAARRRTT